MKTPSGRQAARATAPLQQSTPEASIPAIIKTARWIWPVENMWDLYNCYAQFRKTFELAAVPKKAPLYITADQSYQLYINGHYVCRGPARGFQKSWPYDEIDVSTFLHKGHNCIAVRAYTPGISNFQYLHQGYAGLLIAAQWGKTQIQTSPQWRSRRQTGINRNRVPASMQLFPQEDIDLRSEDPAWLQPEYDDSHWQGKTASVVWNAMPWYTLEPRGIPILSETLIQTADCIGVAKGKTLQPNEQSERNIAIHRHLEGLAHQPASGTTDPALTFASTKKGEWRSYLIDFGKTVVGSILLDIADAKGSEVVETFHAETIDAEKLEPHFQPAAHCRMAFAHRLVCREGAQQHDFYHTFGFRYMVLTVRNNTAPLTIRLRLRTTLYPHDIRGSFASSDPQLEKIWQVCAWTQQVCSLDAYVDTPWREQAQWWGDARVQSWNSFHLSGDDRLLLRGIRQIASQCTPAGITYGHSPTMAHGCVLPDFTLVWLCTLWDSYRQSGSIEAFLAQQTVVKSALAYFEEWTDSKSGLLHYDNRYWLFLDWTELQKDGHSSVYNLWLLYALGCLQELYTVAADSSEARRLKQWEKRLRVSLRQLLRPNGLLSDGILPSGKINPHCSIHAQTLSLMTNLAPEHEQAMLDTVLLPFLRDEITPSITPSAYWITYVYSTLAGRGYGAEVVNHIRNRWEPMLAHGTTWENWSPQPGNESHSHAWSAHPLFHLMQILGGVRQSSPGWERIRYAPSFIGEHAAATIPSPRGDIRSHWKRTGDQIEATLILPTGVSAEVTLPGQRKQTVQSGTHRFCIKA